MTVTFNQGETTKTINVTVNGDTLFEGDETFTVTAVDAADAANTATRDGDDYGDDEAAPEHRHRGRVGSPRATRARRRSPSR